jgi:FkbM family methyltransferase
MTRALHHAEVMSRLHRDIGFIPNYEDVLEFSYRQFVRPGQTVLDIGAHAGRHTAVFAELVGVNGSVHAFEPLPVARQWLAGRGLPSNVNIYPVALSTESGEVTFYYCEDRPEESGLMERSLPSAAAMTAITVQTRTLDSYLPELGGVDFIKIDAEGAEIGCLRGASRLIAEHRPLITVEYGYPGYSAFHHTKRTLYDLAASYGYRIGDLFGSLLQSLEEWERVCDAAYWDWYLIPIEREHEWVRILAPQI